MTKKYAMCFSKNAKFLFNGNQVVAVHRYDGRWMRFSKECYRYLLKGMEAGFLKDDFLRCFMDEDDRAYIKKMIEGLEIIGVVVDTKKRAIEEKPHLDNVQISLTNRCNLQCKHCSASAKGLEGEEPLSTDDIKSIIDKLVPCRMRTIVLSGGEPLVRKDFFDIVHYIKRKDKNVHVVLMTNSLLITADNVRGIVENVDSVDISLDGYDEESCSRIRGKNVFSRVIKSIELLQEKGMKKISLSMVSLGRDYERDYKFRELCKKLNVEPMIRRLSFIGRAKENEEYLRKLEKVTKEKKLVYGEKLRTKVNACSCSAGIRTININEACQLLLQ